MRDRTFMNAKRWRLCFGTMLLLQVVTFVAAMWLDSVWCDVILVSQSAVIVAWAVLMSFLGSPRWRTFWVGMAVFALSFAYFDDGFNMAMSSLSHFGSRGLANAYGKAFLDPHIVEQPLVLNPAKRWPHYDSYTGPTPILKRGENAYRVATLCGGRIIVSYESEAYYSIRRIKRRISAMLTILTGLVGGGLSSWLFRRNVGFQPTS